MSRLIVACCLVLLGAPAWAQDLPVNPRVLHLTPSPDHDRLESYEVDIVQEATGTVVQTLDVGLQAINATTGELDVAVNVQPVDFARYVFVARAVARSADALAEIRSEDSAPSNVWVRAPGRPGQPRAE